MYYALYEPEDELLFACKLYTGKRLQFQTIVNPIPLHVAIAAALTNHHYKTIFGEIVNPFEIGVNNGGIYDLAQIPEKVLAREFSKDETYEIRTVTIPTCYGAVNVCQFAGDWNFLMFLETTDNKDRFWYKMNIALPFARQWFLLDELAEFESVYCEVLEF